MVLPGSNHHHVRLQLGPILEFESLGREIADGDTGLDFDFPSRDMRGSPNVHIIPAISLQNVVHQGSRAIDAKSDLFKSVETVGLGSREIVVLDLDNVAADLVGAPKRDYISEGCRDVGVEETFELVSQKGVKNE